MTTVGERGGDEAGMHNPRRKMYWLKTPRACMVRWVGSEDWARSLGKIQVEIDF
jgi:hypothetical protein